jgi:D-3-phosphoglycerate dehydrogenase
MYKIRLYNKISQNGLSRFAPESFTYDDTMEDYDGIMVRSAALHEVAFPDSLLAIARAGAGVNNIPVDECAKKGIVVFNTPGANANAVKELVLAGLFLASRDVVGGIEWAKSLDGETGVAKLVEKGKGAFAGPELAGKTLGVIGLGAIGAMVANAAVHLGMHVMGYDPYISVKSAWSLDRRIVHAVNVEDIYKNCDYISIHVPLMDATRGMINDGALSLCKDGVRLLNFSRAALVDTDALKAALESGKIARYVTDFPDENVLTLGNVVPIPHLGASTPESEENCATMAAQQLSDYLLYGNIVNAVNFPAVEMAPSGLPRICILHENKPSMISQFTTLFGDKGVNIENLLNKSKGDVAYTLLDVEKADDATVAALKAIDGVIRVRVIA